MYVFISSRISKFLVVENPADIGELRSVLKTFLSSGRDFRSEAASLREEFLPHNDWTGLIGWYLDIFDSLANRTRPDFEEVMSLFGRY